MEVNRHGKRSHGYGTIDPQSPSDNLLPPSPGSQIGAACPEDVSEYSYPDGGLKAWLVVFGCFCAFFSALSFMNSIGVYHSWIASHQLRDEGAGKIGWIFGFYNFLTFVASLFIGPAFDSYGPRPLCAAGPVFLLAQYTLLGFCRTYWQFFFCISVLGGIGTCVLFTCAIGTIQRWFFHRRGLAMGLAISGGSASGIVLPLIISSILPKIGFQRTTLTVSVVLLPFEIAAVVLMKTPALSGKHRQSLRTKGWKAMPSLRLLLDLQPFLMALGLLLGEVGIFIPMTYVTSYALNHDMSLSLAYYLITAMSCGSLLGRCVAGFIGDHIGWFNTQIIILGLSTASILGIWLPAEANPSVLWLFVILFGFCSGSSISLAPVCMSQLCKRENYGEVSGTLFTFSSIGYGCISRRFLTFANLLLTSGLSSVSP